MRFVLFSAPWLHSFDDHLVFRLEFHKFSKYLRHRILPVTKDVQKFHTPFATIFYDKVHQLPKYRCFWLVSTTLLHVRTENVLFEAKVAPSHFFTRETCKGSGFYYHSRACDRVLNVIDVGPHRCWACGRYCLPQI